METNTITIIVVVIFIAIVVYLVVFKDDENETTSTFLPSTEEDVFFEHVYSLSDKEDGDNTDFVDTINTEVERNKLKKELFDYFDYHIKEVINKSPLKDNAIMRRMEIIKSLSSLIEDVKKIDFRDKDLAPAEINSFIDEVAAEIEQKYLI